jgi:hypothetical protein
MGDTHLPTGEATYDRREFELAPERVRSPEWDYGVQWRRNEQADWPIWRVAWIIETGELYATPTTSTPAGDAVVVVLGVVPKVGDYPYASDGAGGYRSASAWSDFLNAQPIEQVMEGWAEGGPRTLDWIRDRLAAMT